MIQGTAPIRETANERFKRAFGRWLWASFMLAVILHFGVLQLFPKLTAAVADGAPEPPPRLIPLPDYDIPPPPPEIERPVVPVPGKVEVDKPRFVPRTDDLDVLPPPPPGEGRTPEAGPFTPYTVAPRLKDPQAALQTLERHYPPLLKDAGVTGEVVIRAFVDSTGHVRETAVMESSGVAALDQAALAAVMQFEFTPAMNRDRRVAVWVRQLIVFESR